MAAERKARRVGNAERPNSTSTMTSEVGGAAGAARGARSANPATAPIKSSAPLRALPGYLLDDGNADFLRLVNERVRLGILSALAVNERLAFADLKGALGATDGNLSVHARKLEEAGYIDCRKRSLGGRPCTEYALTERGRRGFERYLGHMESLIAQMKGRPL